MNVGNDNDNLNAKELKVKGRFIGPSSALQPLVG
jgi:hypothetical protein